MVTEEKRHYVAEWKRKNPERVKSYHKTSGVIYAQKNKEKIRLRKKQWSIDNAERIRERNRTYYLQNKAKVEAANKKWRLEHPEAARHISLNACAKRRARLAGTSIGKVSYIAVRERCGMICGICKLPIEGKFEYDHIIPLALGGSHTEENLQLAHPFCNQSKGSSLSAEKSRKEQSLSADPSILTFLK